MAETSKKEPPAAEPPEGRTSNGKHLDERQPDGFINTMTTIDPPNGSAGVEILAGTANTGPAPVELAPVERAPVERKPLTEAAQRALAEAEARRAARTASDAASPTEVKGRGGLDPARYGDWEVKGIASDF